VRKAIENLQLETWNLETWNLKPETWNLKPGTWNLKPKQDAFHSRKLARATDNHLQ
jgi:hypothetical protein